jgi:CheY-like chemotaxis protein
MPAQTESQPEAPRKKAADLPRGSGELILVVDDEAPVRFVTRRMLEAYGYRVVLAADGSEAVALYEKQKADVAAVITDMMMPVMDGPATIRALRALQPDVRIIASSGLHGRGNDPYSASIASVRHFLSKPYTAETLLTALRRVLTSD